MCEIISPVLICHPKSGSRKIIDLIKIKEGKSYGPVEIFLKRSRLFENLTEKNQNKALESISIDKDSLKNLYDYSIDCSSLNDRINDFIEKINHETAQSSTGQS